MSHYVPKDPDFEARVRDSFSRQGAMALIGAEIVRLTPGECDIAVSYRPDLAQQHHFFHGVVVGMVADSAGGYAAFSLMPADATVLTVEYKMNLVAPADGSRLIARAGHQAGAYADRLPRRCGRGARRSRASLCHDAADAHDDEPGAPTHRKGRQAPWPPDFASGRIRFRLVLREGADVKHANQPTAGIRLRSG